MKPKNLILFALALCACIPIASATTWYVDDDGGADFIKIQDALNEASNGDTIYVFNGNYNETLVISKSIILQGQDQNTTIYKLETIHGMDSS